MANYSTTYADQELFRGIKARDREVHEYVNREYRPMIHLLIQQMGGSVEDAEVSFRMNHRKVPLEAEAIPGVEVPDYAERDDLGLYKKLFRENFKKLPQTCREILALHIKDLQNSEIARLMKLTEAYVRKRKSNCTRMMIKAIQKTSEYHKLMGLSKSSLFIRNRHAR